MPSGEAGLSRGLTPGMAMGGHGKVLLTFWVLGKRVRLSREARSIPPAGGSVSPHRPCAEAKRSPGSLRAPALGDLEEPQSSCHVLILGRASPSSTLGWGVRQGDTSPSAPTAAGCSKSIFPGVPGGMAAHPVVSASLWTAASTRKVI